MERVFVMPDLGEGLEEGRIVEWLVGEGDLVALNQPVVEVETAKAAVEIPSPFAGTIVTLHGGVDADVPVGAPLITFEVEAVPALAPDTDDGRPRTITIPTSLSVENRRSGGPIKATPTVRKRAKELGIDIESVDGTGPDGRVTEADVQRVADRDVGVDPAVQRDDRAGERRRDLDRRLRGLHLDERLVERDEVPFTDQPLDDPALLEALAEVRHHEDAFHQ